MNSPIVFITFTGMFLSMLLFLYNDGYKKANAYLAGFLCLSSLFILIQYVFIFSHSLNTIMFFAAGLPSTVYLIGPFAYLYVRSILRDHTRLSTKDYFHFLIFSIVFIGTIPYIFSAMEHKLIVAKFIESNNWGSLKYRPNAIVPPIINRFMRPLHPLVYALATWKLLYNYKDKIFNSKNHSYDFIVIKKWLLIFSGFLLAGTLLHLVIFLNSFAQGGKAGFIVQSYPLMALFSVIYILMLVSLHFFPHILYGMPFKTGVPIVDFVHQPEFIQTAQVEETIKDKAEQMSVDEKYVQLFAEDYLQEINTQLRSWSDQQLFLHPDCTIASLAIQTQIPQHHLSYYFNTYLAIKFTDWRNNLKVDYAKLLLDQDITTSITMEALAVQCGFSSQTTFNRAFKNLIGITPSQYGKFKA